MEELKFSAEELGKNEELAKTNEKFLQIWNVINFVKILFVRINLDPEKLIPKNLSAQLTDSSVDVLQKTQSHLDSLKVDQIKTDIANQTSLFSRWTSEQENELKTQIKNIEIELKKKNILERLDDLERQEERLTFFDRQEEIVRSYDRKGFPEENPADIPIEPDESAFALRAERHFKPWPKYKNRPKPDLRKERDRESSLESLRTIYLNKSQTA